MTDAIHEAIHSSRKKISFLQVAKTTTSLLTILGGLHIVVPAIAASQDGLRPRSSAPSLLDPQSESDEKGFVGKSKTPQAFGAQSTPNQTRTRIRAIKLTGNTVYTTNELLAVLAEGAKEPFLPSALTFEDIQNLANKITDFYHKNGYLVGQAIVPQQDVTDGTLMIRIVEGRLDDVVAAPEAWNKDNKLIRSFRSVYKDDPKAITEDEINHALAIAGETTGNINKAELKPSAKSGGSNLVISTQRLPILFYGFTADNMGNKSLGEYRLNNYVGGNSWLTDGDYTRFEFGTSNEFKRSKRFDLIYSMPVTLDGWSVSARAWSTEYDLGGTFANTHATGTAQAGEVSVNYALQRGATSKSDWKSGYTYVKLADKTGIDDTNNARHVHLFSTVLSGFAEYNYLKTRARNIYAFGATLGNLAFDDANAAAINASETNTKGTFGLVNASASREQILFDAWSLYGFARGQTANTNLDSYNKMSLGGPSAVRAYAGGESAGDKAVIGTAELRYLYPFNLFGKESSARIAAFYDLGWSQINITPVTSVSPVANTATRGGYGLELNVFWASTIGWQLFWAHTSDNTRISQVDGKRSRFGTSISGSF